MEELTERPRRKKKEVNYAELNGSSEKEIKSTPTKDFDPNYSITNEYDDEVFDLKKRTKKAFKVEEDVLSEYKKPRLKNVEEKRQMMMKKAFEFDVDEEDELSEYEKQRLKNVEENRQMMIALGIIEAKEELSKVMTKKKPVKIQQKKIRKNLTSNTPIAVKRSLRLQEKQGKTSTESLFSPVMNDTPLPSNESLSFYKSRKLEDNLSMTEDGSSVDFLDNLRTCLTTSTSEKTPTKLPVDVERLINDLRGLNVTALQPKVVNKRIQSLCVHPTEEKLLVIAGGTNGGLGLWDVASTDSGLAEYEPHVRPINCISVSSADHTKLFSTSHDGTLRLADIQKASFALVYETDESLKGSHITWHCELNEHSFLVAHGDGVVGIVDQRLGPKESLTQSFECHIRSVRTVQLHPTQGNYFLTSSGIGESKIFDIRNKSNMTEPICSLEHIGKSGNGLTSAFFSPDGNKVLTTCNDDKLRIFDISSLNNPKEAHRINHDNHTGRWLSVFKAKWHPISSDVFFVGSMQYPKRIQIYNGNGVIMKQIMSDDMTTICPVLDFHPTQPILAGGDSVGRVYIFSTSTLKTKFQF
uniref:WD repeat-containing protein 76 n=1 Tax=Clastoptera arizonana TaxID=38151 RepID=A0A1B6CKM1_9HEMI